MKRVSTNKKLNDLSAALQSDSDESVDHYPVNPAYVSNSNNLRFPARASAPSDYIPIDADIMVTEAKFSDPRKNSPKYVAITTNPFSNPADLKGFKDALITQSHKEYYSIDEKGVEQFFSSLDALASSSTCKAPECIIIVLAHIKGEIFPEKQITSLIQRLAKIQTQYCHFNFQYGLRDLAELSANVEALDKNFFYERLSNSGFGTFMQTTVEEQNEVFFYERPEQKIKDKHEAIEMKNLVKLPITMASLKGRFCLYFYDFDDKKPITYYIRLFNQHYVPTQQRLDVWSRASNRILDRLLKEKHVREQQNAMASTASFPQTFFHPRPNLSSAPFQKLEEELSDQSSEIDSEPSLNRAHRTPFGSPCCTLL